MVSHQKKNSVASTNIGYLVTSRKHNRKQTTLVNNHADLLTESYMNIIDTAEDISDNQNETRCKPYIEAKKAVV